MESKVSGHWTNDQLIAELYGVGPEDGHLRGCGVCQERLSALTGHRQALEVTSSTGADVSVEFLAAQRRQIYAKIAQPARWWSATNMRRVASAAATLLVLGGGLMVYEEHQEQQAVNDKVSDAQLAAQVSNMAQDSEPSSTGPLQALFEE